ncbi:MAG: hypothetical protein CVU05_00505 [Bacteroidetes bacterium HGW-Bacteroidetes-21]|jgi:hypothetical protein|nr:MAG: hypothetical protein CVU05_00505 [Bacteroidetes bacterium HGW-Bacteroidetes-21]
MKKTICILLSLVLMTAAFDSFAQDKKGKKKKKKDKVENVQIQTTTTEQKQPVTTETQNKEINPTEKKPVIQANEIKPIANKQPVVTLEQIIAQSKPVVDQKPNGNVNWTEQFIEAKGQSVIDNDKFKNVAQAKAMATRGAVVVAQRNLLEIIKGVNVTSETTVKDMITQSDFIYTRVDGVVKGAQQIGEAIEKDGMMEVTMRIPIYSAKGLAPVVYDNVPNATKKSAMSEVTDVADALEAGDLGGAEGFVFNFNGKQIDPSMFPVVVGEDGNVLFDFYKLYDPTKGKFPQIMQTSREVFEQLGFSKGIQVLDVAESFNGKIQLDKVNAGKVNWDKLGKFAQSASKVLKFALALV